MTRLTFSRRARRDLAEIGDYIARDDSLAARNFIRALREHCDLLKTIPLMGRAPRDMDLDLRCFSHRPYVVYYRYRMTSATRRSFGFGMAADCLRKGRTSID